MKKLTKLALIGLTTGVAFSCQADEKPYTTTTKQDNQAPMTEEELTSQLNDKSKALYQSLNDEGKALARKLAAQKCKGMNDCKGLGSCKTSDHSCAGNNSCKGKSPGPFHDANLAVKVAAQKMTDKRDQSTKPTTQAPARQTNR